MEEELWKDIPGYEGIYKISSLGRVRSERRRIRCSDKLGGFRVKQEKILSHAIDHAGYHSIALWKDKVGKHFLVHRLVALAFVNNPDNLPQVNHIDECKDNNHASNLEWCTAKYNSNYGRRTELSSVAKYIPISMFDMEGRFLKSFCSLKEAQEYIGAKIAPKYLREHHSLCGFQFRRQGEECGPYVENRGKYKRK